MKILITAGSTRTMIDQVRCISNVFKGRTGEAIANYIASEKDQHEVTLLSSTDPETSLLEKSNFNFIKYRTYDDLYEMMQAEITTGDYDVVVHSAAVSDYKPAGVFFDEGGNGTRLKEIDSSSKVGSDHEELFLRMIPTEKIVDKIRDPWGFKGVLVKFKLQVDMKDLKLIDVAFNSMKHSEADIMVANCLEWSRNRAYILSDRSPGFNAKMVKRIDLPQKLLVQIKDKV